MLNIRKVKTELSHFQHLCHSYKRDWAQVRKLRIFSLVQTRLYSINIDLWLVVPNTHVYSLYKVFDWETRLVVIMITYSVHNICRDTGLGLKDETSETTVRNFFLYLVLIPYNLKLVYFYVKSCVQCKAIFKSTEDKTIVNLEIKFWSIHRMQTYGLI